VAARKMGNHHALRVIAPTICDHFAVNSIGWVLTTQSAVKFFFNPQSALHYVECRAALNPTWFRTQSAIEQGCSFNLQSAICNLKSAI
jgi:hypothetical protein